LVQIRTAPQANFAFLILSFEFKPSVAGRLGL